MSKHARLNKTAVLLVTLALLFSAGLGVPAAAQDEGPVLLDPSLEVSTVAEGLTTPTSIAFLDEDEMFVLEKNTGQVKHVVGGEVAGDALDLAVNFASERGLLGIALDPDFANNGYTYLYWSCAAPPPAGEPYFPTEVECADEPQLGDDTNDVLAAPLLGNRVDRFVWDGSSLTWDLNLVKLRSFQHDSAPVPRGQGDEDQPARANHDGGVIVFGADGKLHIIIGDVGRRGALQNLPFGPISYVDDAPDPESGFTLPEEGDVTAGQLGLSEDASAGFNLNDGRARFRTTVPDDQFGGPFPDDAHYTGVILRLNPDGTIPADNPFYDFGAKIGGEIGENLQMTFAYGIRNSFGMDVDPLTGNVWISENGEDAYDELNLVQPGFNSGWIQIMGPVADVANYKQIETTSLHFEDFPNLQQFRWGPENIADTPVEALKRLYWLPGSRYSDPEFAWEFAVAPAAVGFVKSQALGAAYDGDLFVGMSVPLPLGGPLLRFDLDEERAMIAELEDPVAQNQDFNSLIESEQFLIGTGFGIVTDIETGPNGNLFVVSLDHGAVYEISRSLESEPAHFSVSLSGDAEVPGPGDPDGSGNAQVSISQEAGEVCFAIVVSGIALPATGAHIHVGGADVAGDVVVPFTPPDESAASAGCVSGVDPALIEDILQNPSGYYVNVHTEEFPAGAVRGQLPSD